MQVVDGSDVLVASGGKRVHDGVQENTASSGVWAASRIASRHWRKARLERVLGVGDFR
jgi:hypothetical protein